MGLEARSELQKRKVGRSGQITENKAMGEGARAVKQCGRDQASQLERPRLHNERKQETATSAGSWSRAGTDG